MKPTYAVYPPAQPDLPFLAVVLEDGKPVTTFSCEDERSADRLLVELKARHEPMESRVS